MFFARTVPLADNGNVRGVGLRIPVDRQRRFGRLNTGNRRLVKLNERLRLDRLIARRSGVAGNIAVPLGNHFEVVGRIRIKPVDRRGRAVNLAVVDRIRLH